MIAELGGEKIDIIEYTENVKDYIARALSPAEIDDVVIIDEEKRSAVAIVNSTQLSLAVGKQGMNVRLANRLVDWNILVKTEEDFKQMDIYSSAIDRAESLFVEDDGADVISSIHELPGITEEIVGALNNSGITEIQDVVYMTEEQIRSIDGMTDEMVSTLLDIIANTVEIEDEEDEIVEEGDAIDEEEIEDLRCPECNGPIEIGMSECPHCGIGLTFEYYEDDK